MDCLGLMREAAKELKVGELISANGFQLGSALAAIEIMDPRVDTGMFPTAVDTVDFDRYCDHSLSDADLSGILDRLLLCEACWLDGQNLSGTLWTFIPLHNLSRIKNGALKTYCRSIHFTIRLVDEILQNAQVFYEEDINLDRFGIAVGMFGFNDIQRELKETLGILRDARVVNHFRFRLAFLEMLEPFSGQHAPYASDLECLTLIIKEYSANLNQIFAESFFRPIEDSKMFDETMFRKLSTRAPPKKQQQLSRQQTFDIYQSIGQQLEMLSERLRSQKITLFSLMDLVFRIPSVRPSMNILTRSLLMIITCSANVLACQYPATRLIQESVQYYTDPPYFASNSIQISQLTDEFLNEVAQSLGDALMSFFRNASRVHRALPKIIALFDQLQAKTETIDSQLHDLLATQAARKSKNAANTGEPYYLANWVYSIKLRLMERMLTLGLELELYNNCELMQVYWYLDFLSSTQIQNYNRVISIRKSPFPDQFQLVLLKLKQSMMRGLLNGIEYLRRDGFLQIDRSSSALDSPTVCFANRFRAFMNLGSPQTVSYEQFLESTDTLAYDILMVLDAALNNWTAVKQLLVNLQESINNQNWFLPNLFQQDVDQWKAVSVANEVLLRVIKARRAQFLQQKTVVQLDFDKSPCLASFRKQ